MTSKAQALISTYGNESTGRDLLCNRYYGLKKGAKAQLPTFWSSPADTSLESILVGQVEFSGHPLAEAFLLIGSLQSG